MTEYRQNPGEASRGRHARSAQQPAQRPSQPVGRAQYPTTARPAVGYNARQGGAGQSTAYPTSTAQVDAYRRTSARGGYRPVQTGSGGGKPTKKKGGPWRVVFWIALVVLAAALIALGVIAFSYWQGQHAYDEVASVGFEAPDDIESAALSDLEVDWDALLAINPDTVGWVYIPGTQVNYPIVHTSDNETYLTRDFNGQQAWGATYGCIFLSAENAADFSDANNIIYGHHLNNGSMFAALADFDNADTFNAHRTVYVLTPQGNYRLKTFSIVHCAADDPLAQITFADEAERVSYVQDKVDRSEVTVSDAPTAADMAQTFAFATCDNLPSDGRYVLFAYVEDSTAAAVSGGDGATVAEEAGSVVQNPDYAAAEAA